jgi:predicted Zn-dependent peptidase
LGANGHESPGVLDVKTLELSNGLKVWLNEDHSQTKIYGAVVVNAGARDCPDTGIAHYFEHIMFKGTDKIGTIDYLKEKDFLDSISLKYDELAMTTDDEKRAEIQKEINRLSVEAARFAIPNEFSSLITRYGGNSPGAYTNQDITVYFNTFSPQYIMQWSELNSERLISPVFRLFQSELETVYEEVNIHNSNFINTLSDEIVKRAMRPSPYMYSVAGSAESLKNPRLSEMKAFFGKYYVASNMCLILSGDFDTNQLLPVLEKTFARIPRGEKPERKITPPDYFKGKETFDIFVKIPELKIGALVYKDAVEADDDFYAFAVAKKLLNNDNTGYLDRLTHEGEVKVSDIGGVSYNEASAIVIFVTAESKKLEFDDAKEMALKEINRIKVGDFTDEMFEGTKLALKNSYSTALETIAGRSELMISCFSNNMDWEEKVRKIADIDAITKEDVIKAANKYFGEDYLEVRRKDGHYTEEFIPKPDYLPVRSPNTDSSSVFAKELAKQPVEAVQLHFLDFEKDVETRTLSPLARLFVKSNPVNDIFTVRLSYRIGTDEDGNIEKLSEYLGHLGTKSLSYGEFRSSLYHIGGNIAFGNDNTTFAIEISGNEKHFKEIMALGGSFMKDFKVDKDAVKMVKSGESKRTPASLASALCEKVMYGKESEYLRKENKVSAEEFAKLFELALKTECDILYCGALSADEIERSIKEYLPVDKITRPTKSPVERKIINYEKPTVYFVDAPNNALSYVYCYIPGGSLDDMKSRNEADLFAAYFGGNMTSLMFQEMREFRSLIYFGTASYEFPAFKNRELPSHFYALFATQSDKTPDAVFVLDSLLKDMPVVEKRVEDSKRALYNGLANDYPTFRSVAEKIAYYKMLGYDDDPAKIAADNIPKSTSDDLKRFYEQHVKGRPIVYCIVGNAEFMDFERLSDFGKVVKVKENDLFRR